MKILLSLTFLLIISYQSFGQKKYEFILAPESLNPYNPKGVEDDPELPKRAPVDTLGAGNLSTFVNYYILIDAQQQVKKYKEKLFSSRNNFEIGTVLMSSLENYGGFINSFSNKEGSKVSYFTYLDSDTIKTLFNPKEFTIESILDSNRILVRNPKNYSETGIIDYEGRFLLNFSNWYRFERRLSKNLWIVNDSKRKTRFCVLDIDNMAPTLDFDLTIDYRLIEEEDNPFDKYRQLNDLGLELIKNVKSGYLNFLTNEGVLLNMRGDFDLKSIEFIGKSLILKTSNSSYLISKSNDSYINVDLNFAPIEVLNKENSSYLLIYKSKTPIEKSFKENKADYFVGIMDLKGRIIIPTEYDSVIDSDSANVVLRKNNYSFLFDLEGKLILSRNNIKILGNNSVYYSFENGINDGVYSLTTKTYINTIFDYCQNYQSVKIVSYKGKFGLLNSEDNKPMLNLEYDGIKSFTKWDDDKSIDENLLLIRKNNLYGVFDFETNKFLIDVNFDGIKIVRIDGEVHFLAYSKLKGNKLFNQEKLLLGSKTLIPLEFMGQANQFDINLDYEYWSKEEKVLEIIKVRSLLNGKWENRFYNLNNNKMFPFQSNYSNQSSSNDPSTSRINVEDLIVYMQKIKLDRKIVALSYNDDGEHIENTPDIDIDDPFEFSNKKNQLIKVNKYGIVNKEFVKISKPIYDFIQQKGQFIICQRGVKSIILDIFNSKGILLFSNVKNIIWEYSDSQSQLPTVYTTIGGLLPILTKFGNTLRWNYIDSEGKVIDFKSEDSLFPVIYVESPKKISKNESDVKKILAEDKPAMFPGGPKVFGAFLQRILTYPSSARRADKGGKVIVEFVINSDGSASDYKIINSVGYGCDEEALRVIKSVTRWEPKVVNGEKVSSVFVQPITFKPDN